MDRVEIGKLFDEVNKELGAAEDHTRMAEVARGAWAKVLGVPEQVPVDDAVLATRTLMLVSTLYELCARSTVPLAAEAHDAMLATVEAARPLAARYFTGPWPPAVAPLRAYAEVRDERSGAVRGGGYQTWRGQDGKEISQNDVVETLSGAVARVDRIDQHGYAKLCGVAGTRYVPHLALHELSREERDRIAALVRELTETFNAAVSEADRQLREELARRGWASLRGVPDRIGPDDAELALPLVDLLSRYVQYASGRPYLSDDDDRTRVLAAAQPLVKRVCGVGGRR